METTKLEGLSCFKLELEVEQSPLSESMNCLILESNPRPVYYSRNNFPPKPEVFTDRHLYLLVKNSVNCFQDIILRNSCRIIKQFDIKMKIFPGSMTFQNKDVQCIRIDVSKIEQLSVLITELEKLGIKLLKNQKVKPYNSFIQYKRYIEYQEIEENVFHDKKNPNRYFFKINKQIEFKEFSEGIIKIKNGCNYHLFDSFLTDIYIKNEMIDFIGIYSKHCDQNRFSELKQQIALIYNQ